MRRELMGVYLLMSCTDCAKPQVLQMANEVRKWHQSGTLAGRPAKRPGAGVLLVVLGSGFPGNGGKGAQDWPLSTRRSGNPRLR